MKGKAKKRKFQWLFVLAQLWAFSLCCSSFLLCLQSSHIHVSRLSFRWNHDELECMTASTVESCKEASQSSHSSFTSSMASIERWKFCTLKRFYFAPPHIVALFPPPRIINISSLSFGFYELFYYIYIAIKKLFVLSEALASSISCDGSFTSDVTWKVGFEVCADFSGNKSEDEIRGCSLSAMILIDYDAGKGSAESLHMRNERKTSKNAAFQRPCEGPKAEQFKRTKAH